MRNARWVVLCAATLVACGSSTKTRHVSEIPDGGDVQDSGKGGAPGSGGRGGAGPGGGGTDAGSSAGGASSGGTDAGSGGSVESGGTDAGNGGSTGTGGTDAGLGTGGVTGAGGAGGVVGSGGSTDAGLGSGGASIADSSASPVDAGVRVDSGSALDASAPVALFSDDFENEVLETSNLYSLDYTAFVKWTLLGGGVDVTVLPNGYISSPGGYGPAGVADGIVVDMCGSATTDGVLETRNAISFQAGKSYTLAYSFGNAKTQQNSVTVSIPGLVSETRTQASVQAFTRYSVTFVPGNDVNAKLRFTSNGGGDFDGLLLDDVQITTP